MRIALVSEHADPLTALGGVDAGGQNVHVAALAGGLARRGHEVTVHTRRTSPGGPSRVLCEDGYVVDHVTAGPPAEVPKDDLLPHVPELAAQLHERWRAEPVDLVHAHFWMSGLASLEAARGTGVPVLQTFHALGSVKRRQQGRADTSPVSRIDHERRLCREVDHVVATCSDEVRELRRLGLEAGRATVIPCGVDVDRFAPGPPPATGGRRHRVLTIGRLVPRKGVGDVVEALAALPDVELVVAGGPGDDALHLDPELLRLRDLAESRGVLDRVRFLGGVGRDRVPDLIRDSDVVVTVPWYEPFGIVPLEAMACGRPVVGSRVGGLLDTVVPGKTGELVPPRDPAALARTLRALLDDPARRAAYGEAGRRRAVQHYDWRQVVARTEAVYRAVARASVHEGSEVAR
ncbi:glycosyltransferase [Nocardioides aurantiacus]|uniref:glycosyltransferase n=1 Tax=Nocardioides aurantiacus TaxID=86796 RepID=UPI00403FAFC3